MKKTAIVFFLITFFGGSVLMAQPRQAPAFYTDKNRYFSFIPPVSFVDKEDYPTDPRSKVTFFFKDKQSGKNIDFIILAYKIETPRTLRSLEEFINGRIEFFKKEKKCSVSEIESFDMESAKCLKYDISVDGIKSLNIIGYPEGKICLSVVYSAPEELYDKYLPEVMESVKTIIPLKGLLDRNEDLMKAQNLVWMKKEISFLLSNKNYGEAFRLIEPLIQDNPSDAKLNLFMGQAYNGAYKHDEAIPYLIKAYKADPSMWQAYFQMGTIYFNKNELETARKYFLSAIKANPDAMEPKINLAVIYRKTGSPKEAIALYKSIIKNHTENVIVLFNLGRAYLEDGKINEAMNAFEDCLRIDKNNAASMVNLAACYLAVKNYAKANELCETALRIDPSLDQARKIAAQIKKESKK